MQLVVTELRACFEHRRSMKTEFKNVFFRKQKFSVSNFFCFWIGNKFPVFWNIFWAPQKFPKLFLIIRPWRRFGRQFWTMKLGQNKNISIFSNSIKIFLKVEVLVKNLIRNWNFNIKSKFNRKLERKSTFRLKIIGRKSKYLKIEVLNKHWKILLKKVNCPYKSKFWFKKSKFRSKWIF